MSLLPEPILFRASGCDYSVQKNACYPTNRARRNQDDTFTPLGDDTKRVLLSVLSGGPVTYVLGRHASWLTYERLCAVERQGCRTCYFRNVLTEQSLMRLQMLVELISTRTAFCASISPPYPVLTIPSGAKMRSFRDNLVDYCWP